MFAKDSKDPEKAKGWKIPGQPRSKRSGWLVGCRQASIHSGVGEYRRLGSSRIHPVCPPSALPSSPPSLRQDHLRAKGGPGLPVVGMDGKDGVGVRPGLPRWLRWRFGVGWGELTFSVSRSFTVGNGVRADILRGRRGRAGGPAGGGPRRASARAGWRARARERGNERENERARERAGLTGERAAPAGRGAGRRARTRGAGLRGRQAGGRADGRTGERAGAREQPQCGAGAGRARP